MGAWIETRQQTATERERTSHPVWVRGLKHQMGALRHVNEVVAPRVGAWIETSPSLRGWRFGCVAPRVGAWIETGLLRSSFRRTFVAPRVGAWIET